MKNHEITSPEPTIPPVGYQTLPEYLLDKAKEFADKGKSHFAIDANSQEKRYFSKFDIETKKVASALYKSGLRKGGVVIYMPAEMIKLHMFLTGVWRANGICRATYPDDDSATLEVRIQDSNCKHVLCDTNRVETCKAAAKNIPWPVEIITTEKLSGYLSVDDILDNEDGQSCPSLEVTGEDPALMLSTSGTTGSPKAAVFKHAALVEHVHHITYFPFTESKPNILFSSAPHYTGTMLTLGLLASGKTAIVAGIKTKELLCKTVTEMKPGTAFAFPTLLLSLKGYEEKGNDISSLELLLASGGMVTPATRDTLMTLSNVKDFMNAYGLSETGIVLTNVIVKPNPETPTYRDTPDFSVGRPYPGTYIQVLDTETLEPLGPNQRGEICVRNSSLFSSYNKNTEATKESFIGKYFRTGDIGYYDENGFVFVVDRFKEIFKYYSDHISPSEIENVIGQHPLVGQVCVVGVPDPGGNVPRAFIAIKGDHTPGLADEIKEFANDKLATYKQLKGGLYIIPELPKGKTGKVTRNLVDKLEV